MKAALKISLFLNVICCGALVFLVFNHQRPQVPPLPAKIKVPPVTVVPVAAPALPAPDPTPFRWSQLDSRDYHVYVKNLRAIGCPEPTVRAIVTADVDSVYQLCARDLEQKLAQADNGSWTNQFAASGSETDLKDRLQKIPDEEAAKIADLLGLKPARVPDQIAAAPLPVDLSVPLVLQNVDVSALNLSADQKQAIADVRQSFLQQMGGASPTSTDPAYQARWQKAQAAADNMLMAQLGYQAYSHYELLGYQTTLARQATARQ